MQLCASGPLPAPCCVWSGGSGRGVKAAPPLTTVCIPHPRARTAGTLPMVVPMAMALAATVASLYPLLALSAGSGGGGVSGGARTPTKGTPALPGASHAAPARTPLRGARAGGPASAALTPPRLSGLGTAAAGWAAPPPDSRAIESVILPAAELAAAAARAALRPALGCGEGDSGAAGAWRGAARALGGAADLFCSVQHAEVARRLLEAWAPLLLDWVAALQGDDDEGPPCAGAGDALDAWCRVARHWTGLPVTEESAPHLQG
jgi:hypothetical protein